MRHTERMRSASDHRYFDSPFIALAHRGGATYGPNVGRENSVHAFEQAVALGYRYLETDVHVTRDGVLVAFHDERLDRATDASGLIAELDHAQVAEARIGGIDPIPTLAELFETFPDARFNIDIKAPGAVQPLVEQINAFRAQQRVCVGSFGLDRIVAFRRLMGSQVPTAVCNAGVLWTAKVPWLPTVLNDPGVAFQMPVSHDIAGRTIRLLSRAMVERAHAAGKQVHVWTIDDAEEMNSLIDLGVDGLVTNRIDTLREVLIERGLWG